ncbi:19640_t:CDS:2, partial [Gigaspora margarita]
TLTPGYLDNFVLEKRREAVKKLKGDVSQLNLSESQSTEQGKLGGRPPKYVSPAERQKAYRRRKAQAKIDKGEIKGILNMTTGRIWLRKK